MVFRYSSTGTKGEFGKAAMPKVYYPALGDSGPRQVAADFAIG